MLFPAFFAFNKLILNIDFQEISNAINVILNVTVVDKTKPTYQLQLTR